MDWNSRERKQYECERLNIPHRPILWLCQRNKGYTFNRLIFSLENRLLSRKQLLLWHIFHFLILAGLLLTTCLPTDSENRPTGDWIPDGPVVLSQPAFWFQHVLGLKVIMAYYVQVQVISSVASTLAVSFISLVAWAARKKTLPLWVVSMYRQVNRASIQFLPVLCLNCNWTITPP